MLGDVDLSSLSARDRKAAEDGAEVIHALVMKGLLHRLDPKAFPVDAASPEAPVAKEVQKIKPKPLAKLRALIESRRDQAAEFSRVVKSTRGLKLDGIASRDGETGLPASGTVPVGAFSRLNLIVRALHCVDETNPEAFGTDDMILGGMLIGASGNTKVARTIIRSGFDDGDRVEFQSPQRDFGSYSLNTTPSFPKSFFAIFKLLESDGDDADVAAGLEFILRLHSQVAEAQHPPSALLPSLRAVQVYLSLWLSLTKFYDGGSDFLPFAVGLTMNSQNHFGGIESGNLRTANINGHGGTYRIGYKWRLS